MDAEELGRPAEVGRQAADRQGRGVAPDDGPGPGDGLDVAEHRPLDLGHLEDGLLDEVGALDGVGQAARGPQVGLDQRRGARVEQALALELGRLGVQPVEVPQGGVGVRVADRDLEARDGEHLGDAASHVTRSDDGDVCDAHPGNVTMTSVTADARTPTADPFSPATKAMHTWSLFRTLDRYVAPGSMPGGGIPESSGPAPDLLALPAELARHGYGSVQLCHFYLARRDASYLQEVRAAFAGAGVALEALLVDDGDLTDPGDPDGQVAWVSSWLDDAEALGAPRARVVAGQRPPGPATLAASAAGLRQLAARHPDVRVLTENWHALLPDAASVTELLDRTEGDVGFLVDLGNWKGEDRHAQLARVAGLAESCQAKVRADADGRLDLDEYRTCLGLLADAGYAGPLAMVHDGPDPDEWARLEDAHAVVRSVFPVRPA